MKLASNLVVVFSLVFSLLFLLLTKHPSSLSFQDEISARGGKMKEIFSC